MSRVRSFFHGPEHEEPLPFPRNDTHSNRLISNEDAKYYLDDNWNVVHPDTVDRSPQRKMPFEHLQHRSSNVDVSPIEFDVDSDSMSDTELQAAFDDIEKVAREDARPQGNAVAPSGICPEQYARIAANRVEALRRQELKRREIASTDKHATPTKVMKSEAASSSDRRLESLDTPQKLDRHEPKFTFTDHQRFEAGRCGTKTLTATQLDRIASQRAAAVHRRAVSSQK